jgi:hypothetical protein
VYHRVSGSESDRARRFQKCIAQSRDNGKHCRIKSRECCDLNINLIKRWVDCIWALTPEAEQVKPKDTEIGVCQFNTMIEMMDTMDPWIFPFPVTFCIRFYSDTLSWFRANQSLLFLNTACFAENQQTPISVSINILENTWLFHFLTVFRLVWVDATVNSKHVFNDSS